MWTAIAALGAGAINYYGTQKAGKVANAQSAANQAAQLAWNKQQDPFSAGGNREQYVPQLNKLMQGGYQGIQDDPMFQWEQKQGVDNMQRSMSARGMGASGSEMAALQDYGTGMARSYFDKQYARLSDLSGASRGGGAAATGMSPGDRYNTTADQYGAAAKLFGTGVGAVQQYNNPGAHPSWSNAPAV